MKEVLSQSTDPIRGKMRGEFRFLNRCGHSTVVSMIADERRAKEMVRAEELCQRDYLCNRCREIEEWEEWE